MKKIYLVDVSSMFFRAFYAVRPLTSPSGMPVNAIYGFLSMLIKLLKEEKPEYLVFCYDRKEPSFRHEMYEEYKAHRTEMPDELAQQIPSIKKLADLMGIPAIEVPEYEADDLIGTLAHLGRKHRAEVIIVSGDKDFGQVVGDRVTLYDTMKGVRYDSAGVKEKWGIAPEKFIDYLALVGDSSDNIPGVAGIGPKGAQKLLEQFNSLEEIYENLDRVESKSVREKLALAKENAFLSKKLVTIVTDVPLDENLETYRLRPLKTSELRAFLQELNFKTLEKSLLGEANEQSENSNSGQMNLANVQESESPDQSGDEVLLNNESLSVEKTMSLEELGHWLQTHDQVWGMANERGVYLAKDNEVAIVSGESEKLGELTDHKKIKWLGFDLKSFWHRIGARQPLIAWDSQLAAYVVRAGDISDFAKEYKSYVSSQLPELMTPAQLYLAQQKLKSALETQLKQHQGEKVYQDLDLPLSPILLEMENRGIRLDDKLLHEQSLELEKEIAGLEKNIHKIAGENFNIASPKQLSVVLFEKLGLEASKKTKTGFSTDNEVLEALSHPIAKQVLLYRELAKLKSTYVDALPQLTDRHGRVHTRFNQALTTTGRLSSTQPNLQNIPIRTPRGQRVRQAFIADRGKKLLSLDYSQIELRILAHISEDPNLCRAFADDLDIHTATAAEIYSVSLKDVTPELRRSAKAVNFGIAYGQGAFGLAENLGVSRGEAQDIINKYFEKFKNVREYIDSTIQKAHEQGFVETLFGRRRYIDELKAKNQALRKFGERAAINAPIQGTASDLVKKAMIEVAQKIDLDLLLQVHDELIFEASEEQIHASVKEIVQIMEHVVTLRVPLKVNYALGNNWDEAH